MGLSFLPESNLFGESNRPHRPNFSSLLNTSCREVFASSPIPSIAYVLFAKNTGGGGISLLGAELPPAFAATGLSTEQPMSRKIILSVAGNSNRCNAQG